MAKKRPTFTPDALFRYARGFQLRGERSGQGSIYPSFRRIAKHFGVPMSAIEDACSDYMGPGGLDLIVGMRTASGVGSYAHVGEYQVEAYGSDDTQETHPS